MDLQPGCYLWLPHWCTASGVLSHKKHHVWLKINVWMASRWNKNLRALHHLPPAPFPGPHKNHVPFKRYMSLMGRMNGTAWINKFEARDSGPRVSLLLETTITGPQCNWKMYEMWRKGWGSIKIDYLTLRLTGSTGSIASFVPLDQVVEMTPEGKSRVCAHVCLIERAIAPSLLMRSLDTLADASCSAFIAVAQQQSKTSCNPSG